MVGRGADSRWGWGAALGIVVVVVLLAAVPTVTARPGTAQLVPAASLSVSINIAPQTVTVGSQFNVSAQVSPQESGPFTYSWSNVPSGCTPQPMAWWYCTLNSPGQYSVSVTVSNATNAQGSATQGFSVTSNGGSGNGGGNGNGNHGNSSNNNNNNGSSAFNLSSFGPLLVYGLLAGIIAFALLVALTVGVIMIAVTLSRRLPKPVKGGVVCSACKSTAPADAKFCPACAAPLGPTQK